MAGRDAPWPRLISPPEGTVIALDPDIPEDRQKVPLRSTAAEEGDLLYLDGTLLGPAEGEYFWRPVPGHHALTLVAPDGTERDRSGFTVRAPPH
jgi:penicillin-binding protein 1C